MNPEQIWTCRAGVLMNEIEAAIYQLETGLPASALAILGRTRARVDAWKREESSLMPNILPEIGDEIQVAQTAGETLPAKIISRGPAGDYCIETTHTRPKLHGKVSAADYKWNPNLSLWEHKT